VKRAVALFAFTIALSCSSPAHAAISDQGPYQSATTGYVDPTIATFNGSKPLVSCSSSCAAALINQNTDALQAAVNLACASPHPLLRVPPGVYPLFRGGVSHNLIYGVRLDGCSGLVLWAPGAVFRMSGNCGLGDYFMFQLINGAHGVRVLPGATFSGKDAVNCSEHTHIFQFGDTLSVVDDVQFLGARFIEPVNPGDCINFLGGYESTHLIQRVVVAGSSLDCHRAGVTFQHGTTEIDLVGNWFEGTTYSDQLIDHEPTSGGGNDNENLVANLLNPTSGTHGSQVFSNSGAGAAFASQNAYAYNIFVGAVGGGNVRRDWWIGNRIAADADVSSSTLIMSRRADDTWVLDNWLERGPLSNAGPMVDYQQNNGYAPTSAVVRGNRILQGAPWAGGSPNTGIFADGITNIWIIDNDVTYHNALADSGNNGFFGVQVTSHQQAVSGWIVGNRFAKGLQADGVTPAGRMRGGIEFADNTTMPHIGHWTARDNVVDGSLSLYFLNQINLDEGVPIVSGGVILNGGTESLSTWQYRTESTSQSESVASGAVSPSKLGTVMPIGSAGTTHTLADGTRDGAWKYLKWSTMSGDDTLTPAHFGDGTSLSTSTANTWAVLAWDDAAQKWWLVSKSAGVTVNP
jgi:hypothetical protein